MKILIRLLDWIIFLVLFGLAVYWTVDAIEKYNLKITTMSQSLEYTTAYNCHVLGQQILLCIQEKCMNLVSIKL